MAETERTTRSGAMYQSCFSNAVLKTYYNSRVVICDVPETFWPLSACTVRMCKACSSHFSVTLSRHFWDLSRDFWLPRPSWDFQKPALRQDYCLEDYVTFSCGRHENDATPFPYTMVDPLFACITWMTLVILYTMHELTCSSSDILSGPILGAKLDGTDTH